MRFIFRFYCVEAICIQFPPFQLTINMANFFEDNFDAVKNIQQKMEQLYDELGTYRTL